MGNCFTLSSSNETKPLPIDTIFKFPSSLPTWPSGDGFASGYIDLGGLQVYQVTSFSKIWATYEGGPDNLGATFYEPSIIPDGFFMLGCYGQPNNQPLFGWVLAAKDSSTDASSAGNILEKPIDYTLVWSSESLEINQDGPGGYIWLPTPPDGYKALGHVVTTTPEKPSVEKVRCVRSEFTDECEAENWIWGQGTVSGENGFDFYGLRPKNRGIQAQGVSVGTFIIVQNDSDTSTTTSSLACLKNNNFNNLSSMPNLTQIHALFQAYSPWIYFHPKEKYLPASVNWFFSNGVMLYNQGDESNPVPVEPNGSNLPQGGSNDGIYWLDLPVDDTAKERVKKGDLPSSEAYLHVKPMLGATFTDIAVWIFLPFNGPSTAKLGLIDIPLGIIGEHIGDWEHLTLRISNFNGVLHKVFFSQHSGGTWVDAPLLQFQNGNKFVAYSSLNGHPMYSQPGLVMQGTDEIGLRNDTAKSDMVMDTGARYAIVSGENLGPGIVEPPWLNYLRKWGPKITYTLGVEVEKVENLLTGDIKTAFQSLVDALPNEVFGEDGVTGPKVKSSWTGDEV